MTRTFAVLLLVGVTACGPTDPGVCTAHRACPVECETATVCGDGETCSEGFCSTQKPTSSAYAACSLDSDCPRGDYCGLGACTHDCVRDADCSSGTVCSSRGKCIALADIPVLEQAPAQPEAKAPGAIKLDRPLLSFKASEPRLQLKLSKTGSEPVRFRALTDQPWVTVTPSEGTLESSTTLTVEVDRASSGGAVGAQIRLNSTAGTEVCNVEIDRELSGVYSGVVSFDAPYRLGQSSLRLHLFDGGSGKLTGFVEPDRSVLFPVKAAISGTVAADAVTLDFAFAGGRGSAANPHFPATIVRRVKFTGAVVAAGRISGSFTDDIEGPLGATAIRVSGTFELRREGKPTSGSGVALPAVTHAPVASPFSGSLYAECADCPFGANCSDALAHADAYLKNAARFYELFQQKVGTTTSPFSVIEDNCGAAGCINVPAVACAQRWYHAALGTNPARATIGLMDSFQVMADYGVLYGTDRIIRATSPASPAGTLEAELVSIREAPPFFNVGLHSPTTQTSAGVVQTQPVAILDPFWISTLLSVQVAAAELASGESKLSELLKDVAGTRPPFDHLRRAAGALSGSVRAQIEIAQREHRVGQPAAALKTIRAASVQSYIDGAVLAAILAKAGASSLSFTELDLLPADMERLASLHERIVTDKNPAGYAAAYVPFRYSVDANKSNYSQMYSFITATLCGPAKTLLSAAENSNRAFETSSTQLRAQALQHDALYTEQLTLLCGNTDPARCGEGGQIAAAISEIATAGLRVQQAAKRLENLTTEIEIEQQRVRTVTGIHAAHAELVLANGQRMRALDKQQQIVGNTFSAVNSLMNIMLSLPNPLSVFRQATNLVIGLNQANREGIIAREKQQIASLQEAQVSFNSKVIEEAQSAAFIATKLLESATLSLELQIATEAAGQAARNLVDLWQRVALIRAQAARTRELDTANALNLVNNRLIAGVETMKAQRAFDRLLEEAYLTTRALEYELNRPYPQLPELWKARNANQICDDYLLDLAYFNQTQRTGTNQPVIDVMSVRDHLLDLEADRDDTVTGHKYPPAERFRRALADPANRDENGNIRLRFMTYRPKKPLFSAAVCNDRILSVRINIVGDQLGEGLSNAYVRLTHGGTNYLRSCQAPHDLVPWNLSVGETAARTAIVQAGLNTFRPSELAPITDLLWRSVIAGPWELVIEKRPTIEPRNEALRVEGITDIQLILEHDSLTIQQ